MKHYTKLIALLLACTLLLSLLAACSSEETPTESSTEPTTESTGEPSSSTDESTEPTQTPTAPALPEAAAYGENDPTALDCYTCLNLDEATLAAEIAVDAKGDPLLTNSDLQICYWLEFLNFMNTYGSYASMLGLDYTRALCGQSCAEDRNWEQYFVESAMLHFADNYALSQAAYIGGYTLSEEDEKEIADLADPEGEFAAEAKKAGYDSPEAYLQANFCKGVTIEGYQKYLRLYYAASDHYQDMSTRKGDALTEAEVEGYFDGNAESYASQRIEKKNNVSARHILIAPEGDKDATTKDWTEEQWAAAEAKANEVYEEWKKNPTEDNFAALANEHSTDGGSNTKGGLYEDFATNKMVTEFSDWCFDSARAAGDTGIVKTEFGYHIIYFIGQTDTRLWFDTAKSDLVNQQMGYYIEECRTQYPVSFDYARMRVFDIVARVAELSTAATE